MTVRPTAGTARSTRSTGWVPFALVALVLVPAIAGSLRLIELAGGPHLMPANPRITASPAPVVVHIVCAVLYAVLGAFQFSAALRRRHPRWHRRAGRVLVVLGLAVAFSALWMTQFYPRHPGTGELAYLFRLAFGSGMAASIVLGFTAIRRGDVTRHRAWMTRAYALALGAGTQVFTLGHRSSGLRHQRTDQRPEPGRGLGHQPRGRRVRHPPPEGPRTPNRQGADQDRAVMSQTANDDRHPRLPASGRRAPRPALVRLVRRPHPHPRKRRHDQPQRCRRRPGGAARAAHEDPRPRRHPDLRGRHRPTRQGNPLTSG